MSKYYLRKWSDPILRKECRDVDDFFDLDELISAMGQAVYAYHSDGIAAPQLGDDRRVIMVNIKGDLDVFVNPVILGAWGYTPLLECCLSFPGLFVPTVRRLGINVAYQTKSGAVKRESFWGLNALFLQHEIDHLDGKLMFQYHKLFSS